MLDLPPGYGLFTFLPSNARLSELLPGRTAVLLTPMSAVNLPWQGVRSHCGPVSSSTGRNRLRADGDEEVLVHPRLPHGLGAGDRGRRLIAVQIKTDR